MTNHLLQLHLQTTVPLLIQEFLTGQRELVMPRPDLAQTIARYGDHIFYRGEHTAEAVTALAEAVATLAFCPGGVTCFGLHFEVPPEQAREIEAVDVLRLEESWRELAAAVENPPGSLQLSLFEEPPRVAALANLYRDFLSIVNGDESAYPSPERLARYQLWAEELVIDSAREHEGAAFRRFCRVRLAGKQWGMDLMAVGRAYDNGLDYPAPEGWECLKERPAAASGDGRRGSKTP